VLREGVSRSGGSVAAPGHCHRRRPTAANPAMRSGSSVPTLPGSGRH
jgi:hypothetical protein